eukprot:CAMPEP_0201493678 /NCGR_PEP_ID=MMETSP0151_2-20130828/40558_1 /ASSEMBLY_ACC=CAM_ASM_000257 /TAXON_ID=200890 /ORGANISM="Paramoeba atlantica, Strain 621/1 / CCAP 1560/9" /LENGTH=442 /DNA_ID=CAMNT_0047881281 /DNA_START=28 /DNA_END=1356 /DNA_ORIENTATION=-
MNKGKKEENGSLDSFSLIKISGYHYIHVLDANTNITRVESGPQRVTLMGHEKVMLGPLPMIAVSPFHYCVIGDPVVRDKDGKPLFDEHEQLKHRHGCKEVRLCQDPFPLYPNEVLLEDVRPLRVLEENEALVLRADHDISKENLMIDGSPNVAVGQPRQAGEEWVFQGPGTFIPHPDTTILRDMKAIIVEPHTGIHLRALRSFVDSEKVPRLAGEEWCVKKPGPYMPGVFEEVVRIVHGTVLTPTTALHLRARVTFEDDYRQERKAGEEWLVTSEMAAVHVIGVYEEKIRTVEALILSSSQYCVIENPVDKDGNQELGARALLVGPSVRFPQPGEIIKQTAEIIVLNEDQALYVRAVKEFDDDGKKRKPGDRWLIAGPIRYWPPLEVEIIEYKNAIFFVEGSPIKFFTISQLFLWVFLIILIAVLVPQVFPFLQSQIGRFRK